MASSWVIPKPEAGHRRGSFEFVQKRDGARIADNVRRILEDVDPCLDRLLGEYFSKSDSSPEQFEEYLPSRFRQGQDRNPLHQRGLQAAAPSRRFTSCRRHRSSFRRSRRGEGISDGRAASGTLRSSPRKNCFSGKVLSKRAFIPGDVRHPQGLPGEDSHRRNAVRGDPEG